MTRGVDPGGAADAAVGPRLPSCVVVGGGSLTIECCERAQRRGLDLRAIVTDAPDVSTWAAARGLKVVPLGDGSGADWGLDEVDYLLSIVNLRVLGDAALRLARRAAINFHDGPLPGYAGLHVTSWAIAAGEREHAVTWHLMLPDVDAGPILIERRVPIAPFDTARTLNAACFEAGLASFDELLERLLVGRLDPRPQRAVERRWFTRAMRPPLGGALDLSLDAVPLAALARALDFGPYPNALGAAALVDGATNVLVETVSLLDTVSDEAPGTFLGIDADGLRFRCGDRDVILRGLRASDGRPLAPDEAAAQLGTQPGSVWPRPSEEVLTDFAVAMRRWARHEETWVTRLETLSPMPAPLIADAHESTPVGASARVAVRHAIPAPLVPVGERPGDTLLAAVVALFARLAPATGGDVPVRHPDLARVAGAASHRFAPFVPLAVEPPGDEPFDAYLTRFLDTLDRVVAVGGHTRDLAARMPSLAGLDPAWRGERWPLTFQRVDALPACSDRHDVAPRAGLSVTVAASGDALEWRFDPARVTALEVERLQGRLEAFLGDLWSGAHVARATVLSDADRAEQRAWNDTAGPPLLDATVHAAIDAQARRTPTRTALIGSDGSLTYEALAARSNRMARLLVRRGVRRGARVGVLLGRETDMVVTLVAILKAGAAYVPLDPAFPADRIAFMVADADLALVVTSRARADAAGLAGERCLMDDDVGERLAQEDDRPVDVEATRDDLAYLIYTSGSTGRPKGVMLEHGNVLNFMAGMDDVLEPSTDPGTWLAVTSISFDISVLELLWTLARGFTVVLYGGDDLKRPPERSPAAGLVHRKPMHLSLFYFSSDADDDPRRRYGLLLDGARFADANGFEAVWTPERHFHAFGGLFPNPAVVGAAIAAVTERVRIRAGSCVLPLHHPIRVAEEWAVVDNLSGGRVDVSFASGWQPDDFVLAPGHHAQRNDVMHRGIETVRALWRGEARAFDGPDGREVMVSTLPRPVQSELPVWVTAAGNPATFRLAGEMGANVLTHLLGQDMEQLAEKIAVYREAWVASGRPGRGHVSLMLHTFLGADEATVRATVRGPLRSYLQSAAGLIKQFASSFPAFRGAEGAVKADLDATFSTLSETDLEALLEHAFERYYETSGLFGTVDVALETVARVHDADVDEIACLIDFGIERDTVMAGLEHLARLRERMVAPPAPPSRSIPELVAHHDVTHMQCTPSMAQMLVADPAGRAALASLRSLLVGGEALPRELGRTLAALVPGRVRNMYGPTETTIWSTVQDVDGLSVGAGSGTVSIGRPIANTQVYVCDASLEPLPAGVPGELVIGGHGVARGYWARPDVTAERFVPDRLTATVSVPSAAPIGIGSGRAYRTGDLARWHADGTLDFLGRSDFQVKVRGHRIELGEIEAVLDTHEAVHQAVVVARPSPNGDTRLVAYVVLVDAERTSTTALRDHAASHLPAVMVPDAFVVVDAFPLTPNRKVDRRALPEPPADDRPADDAFVAPSTELEMALAAVWRRVLSVDRVGVHDDFFALGGNSLLAVFAVSEASKLGYRMTLATLLAAPTIAGLAAQVAPAVGASADGLGAPSSRAG